MKLPNDLFMLRDDLGHVASKLVFSAVAAAVVSGLVAASFVFDSFDGFDALDPIGWLFPALLLAGIIVVIAAAVRAVRS